MTASTAAPGLPRPFAMLALSLLAGVGATLAAQAPTIRYSAAAPPTLSPRLALALGGAFVASLAIIAAMFADALRRRHEILTAAPEENDDALLVSSAEQAPALAFTPDDTCHGEHLVDEYDRFDDMTFLGLWDVELETGLSWNLEGSAPGRGLGHGASREDVTIATWFEGDGIHWPTVESERRAEGELGTAAPGLTEADDSDEVPLTDTLVFLADNEARIVGAPTARSHMRLLTMDQLDRLCAARLVEVRVRTTFRGGRKDEVLVLDGSQLAAIRDFRMRLGDPSRRRRVPQPSGPDLDGNQPIEPPVPSPDPEPALCG